MMTPITPMAGAGPLLAFGAENTIRCDGAATSRCRGPETEIGHVTQAAAFLLFVEGLGLAIAGLIGIRSLLAGRGVPLVLGYPSYGGGAFERLGIPTTVPLLLAFLVVCVLDLVAGVLVWQEQRSGAVLSLALLPLGAVFWWGFDLPYPPVLALARTILTVLAWNSFR